MIINITYLYISNKLNNTVMAVEKKSFFIERLDSGFIFTEGGTRSAIQRSDELKNIIKDTIDRMVMPLNAANKTISVSIEVENNPPQLAKDERA